MVMTERSHVQSPKLSYESNEFTQFDYFGSETHYELVSNGKPLNKLNYSISTYGLSDLSHFKSIEKLKIGLQSWPLRLKISDLRTAR